MKKSKKDMSNLKASKTNTASISKILEEDMQRKSAVVADCHHPNVYYAEDNEETVENDNK